MGQTATLKKISEQLNLSISTISRALKNHPDISENTKRKVKELAMLMEYEPNSYAVNLRTNKSRVLGVIVPTISNMFYESFISAAEKDARKSGYTLMILQSGDDSLQEAENLKLCKHYRVDGILISVAPDSYSADLLNKYQDGGIPIVFFDKVLANSNFDTVCMADEEAATMAAHTILSYKKKNILALLGNPDLSITQKRRDALLKILEKETDVKVLVQYCANTDEAKNFVTLAIQKKAKPEHIFCMSDEILIGAMSALKYSSLSIPDDISLLAISNGFIPGLYNPEISYIETSGHELGKLAIKRMLEKMEGKTPVKAIMLPSRLVEGGSL
jgi:LacI family transcriptional regulator